METTDKMPLPDFGYANRETRKKQELVFPMAPGESKARFGVIRPNQDAHQLSFH